MTIVVENKPILMIQDGLYFKGMDHISNSHGQSIYVPRFTEHLEESFCYDDVEDALHGLKVLKTYGFFTKVSYREVRYKDFTGMTTNEILAYNFGKFFK
ncbi:hypothetical protein H3019_gp05 [Bacillus phage Karezi]|uniref:Uncharacterized protein n=1 Tax=Bacillus phage Karezi TaxID=2591398 RepID=A0A514AAM1_9CAUD|nr:hypothetical protein H3019_gp05 [Bacillus phage Karezi]QDH50330.1 hypothetical protein KAREZI_5 [Bacillus phage Karezi]